MVSGIPLEPRAKLLSLEGDCRGSSLQRYVAMLSENDLKLSTVQWLSEPMQILQSPPRPAHPRFNIPEPGSLKWPALNSRVPES